MRFFLLFGIALALPTPAEARSFRLENFGNLSVDVPLGWVTLEKRLRVPLLLAAPMPEGEHFRTTLSVYPVEGLNAAQVSDALDGNEASYRKAKDAWVKGKGGTVEKYRKASVEDWDHVKGAKHFGVTYNLNGNHFEESSYYFACKGKPLFVKVLQPLRKGSDKDAGAVAETLRSLTCE